MSRENRKYTVQEVLDLTMGGREIFERELGRISSKNISCPWRSDKNGSFSIKCKFGKWKFQDYGGDQSSGDAIDFLCKLYGISLQEAIDKAVADLGLKRVLKKYTKPEILPAIEEKPIFIEFTDMPFTKAHHEYWNQYELSEKFLLKHHVYAVKDLAFNKVKQEVTTPTFAYLANDIQLSKILRLGVEAKDKWRNGIPADYLWSYYEYKAPVEDLFIMKSRKDELVFKLLGYNTISIQSENAKILLDKNVDRIKQICWNSPIVTMGTDAQGKAQSLEITKATKWRHFNTPNRYLECGINDPAELVKELGLKELDRLIKRKFKK